MRFKELSARVLEPISQWVMIVGIVALCQPWIEVLHRYGVTIILIGLIGFLVFSKIKPAAASE
jgi:type IV secretory pathway VirB2 component (pilin)